MSHEEPQILGERLEYRHNSSMTCRDTLYITDSHSVRPCLRMHDTNIQDLARLQATNQVRKDAHEIRSNHREGLSVLDGFLDRKNPFRIPTAVRSRLKPRDNMSDCCVPFPWTPRSALGSLALPPPRGRLGNIKFILEVLLPGLFGKRAVCERCFLLHSDSSLLDSCWVEGSSSTRIEKRYDS